MDQRSCQSLTLSPNKINNSVTFSKADSRLLKQYRRRHLSLVDKLSSPPIFWTTGGSSDQQLSLSTDFTISNACRPILSLVIMKPETGDNSALSSNADLSSSSSVGKSPSTLTADSNSTFRTLNRKKLTAAVRAVKGKFRNSHYYPKRKIELIRPTVMQIKSDNTEENRISVCLKELEVSQLYLNDVIKKEKLVMLPGSASIVLDIVLKLLLMLNEKRLKTKTTQSLPAKQNASMLVKYNDVYHCLAMLLQHTDKLVVNGKVDATNDRTKVTSLNKNLLDAIQILINAVDETQSKQLVDRSHSLESRVSSSDSSDLGNEDVDFDLLRELDQVNNNSSSGNCSISVPGVCPKFDGVSNESIIVGYDPNKPPPKPPHPNLLLLQKQFGHDTGSVESAVSGTASSGSPPSADSGVESLAAADERCHIENSLLSLDELFARLHLTNNNNQYGGGVDNWSTWSDLSTATSDGNLTLPNLNILRNCHHFEQQQQQHVNNEQQSDQQTTSEEKEELCGDTMIKTKKITTKQVMKKTIVKTSHALVQGISGDLQTVDDYGDLIKRLTGANNGEGELKFVETETYKLNGASQQSIDAGGKFPLATTSEVGNEKPMVNKRLVNVANLNWPKVRPVSEYENSRSSPTVSFGRHAGNGQSTVKVHQNMVQQSTSVQSISRQAMINGKLVADDSAEKSDTSLLKASKSDTFHNGALTDRTGSGSIVEEHREVRCQKTKPSQSTDEPDNDFSKPNAKRNTVSSYIKIFGSYQPGNPSNFHAELASYQNIRDKWQSHEETNKKKAFTFQFSNNSNNNFGSAKGQTRAESDKQPWMNLDKSATAPQTLSTKLGRSDYQNLMDFFELNDRLKFPHRPAVECGPVQKSVTFPKSLAISYVNYLDEEDVSRYLYCKKETEEGPEIRGAPIDVLIVYATQNIANQRGCFYQEAFLITYRTFVSPVDLIKNLIYRYEKFANESSDKDVQKRKIAKNTFSLLVCVVDDLSSADLTDHVLTTLNNFLFRMVYAGELNLSRYLRQRLTNRYQAKQDFFADLHRVLYSPYSPGSLRNITVLDFKSNLLAEQFTYLDWFHFKKIELSELLLWAQQQTEEHSPNLTSFTAHFNNMSYWVRTRILQSADAKEREAVFAKFLKVMHHLKRLGNFNSLFAMLSALDSGSIRRLDWPKGSTEQLAEYTVLTDSSQSFKSYRSALADTKPPCLPYIGIILQDLTFVHIGNPNLLPENHCEGRVDVVNFAKRWQQYTIMDNMRRFKAWPYNLKKNEQVLAYLNDFADHLSEDELWERSEKLKPKPRNGPTLKRTV